MKKIPDSEIEMKNYNGFRADRTLGIKKRGVLTYIKATEAVDADQLIAISNLYVEYQVINMQKRNIVIINVFCPPDCITEIFTSPLNELRTKLIIIYHDFLPTPRRGSHVKSGKTHTQSSRYTP